MTKLSGKAKAAIIVCLALIIVIVSSFVHLYQEKTYWQEDAAEYNRYHWTEIQLMAFKMEAKGFTKEAIKEIYPYINAKIFSSVTGLYPAFNGDAAYTAFLQTYYVSLAEDIASTQNLSSNKLQEAINIFKDATIELKDLSGKILEMTEELKDKVALRKVGSNVYNKAETMIREYCNKYGKKISQLNHS